MLMEQAFFAVPEFLVGAGFQKFDAEGTLVMAYAMAILQELNGRNVNNPIAQIRGEVQYPISANRNADIHLDYRKVGVLASSFQDYGVRPDNWLEAKYFRGTPSSKNGAKQQAMYSLLRDLLRVLALVPEPAFPIVTTPPAGVGGATATAPAGTAPSPRSESTRYLLHVYERKPSDFIVVRRNQSATAPQKSRRWVRALWEPGSHELDDFDLVDEPQMFNTEVGAALRSLQLKVRVANLVAEPSTGVGQHMVLSRVVAFKMSLSGREIEMSTDGMLREQSTGDWAWFGQTLDTNLVK
jgi:hypothetical protein